MINGTKNLHPRTVPVSGLTNLTNGWPSVNNEWKKKKRKKKMSVVWNGCVFEMDHLVERRAGSKAVGGGGGPLRSSSSTYAMMSLCLSSGIQSSTR